MVARSALYWSLLPVLADNDAPLVTVVEKHDEAMRLIMVKADGCVAIEAAHYTHAVNDSEVTWTTLANYGRSAGGVTPFDITKSVVGRS